MVDSELLINEVQKRPVLWDTTSELYKDKNKKKTLLGQKYAPFYWKILKQKQTQNKEIWRIGSCSYNTYLHIDSHPEGISQKRGRALQFMPLINDKNNQEHNQQEQHDCEIQLHV
nr:unnamed protein product [Callosobruchus chinensis]